MEKYSYIYDVNQARFFLSKGLTILDVGIHRQTSRAFFVFNRSQDGFQDAYDAWQNNRQYI